MEMRKRIELLAVLAVAALSAVGFVACGDSGESDPSGSNAQVEGESSQRGGSDEEQIRATYVQLNKDLRAKNAQGACAAMTPKAQKQMGRFIETYKSCPQAARALGDRLKRANRVTPSKISRVAVDGDRARVTAKAEGYGSSAMIFVKHGGAWKLHDTLLGAPGRAASAGR